MTYRSDRTPVEILTAELRGCCNGYVGAPALAVQLVSALRVAGWIVVREDAIRLAQAHARDEADKPKIPPGRLWHEARGNIGVAS